MAVTGKAVGTVGGAAIGTAVGGPVGGMIGAGLGGVVGGLFDSNDGPSLPQVDAAGYQYGNLNGKQQSLANTAQARGDQFRSDMDNTQRRDVNYFGSLGYAQQGAQQANAAVQNANQARQQQLAALGRMQQGNNQVAAFANQPQGPSAAQAQLTAGANQSFAQQMAAARSGQNAGGGAAALRNAQFQQAGIMGQANAQAAELRANEQQAYQQQRLQALGMAQQGYGAEAGAAAGLRGSDVQGAQLQANTALAGGQLQSGAAAGQANQFLQNRQVNDQYALGQGNLAYQQDLNAQHVYDQQLAANMQYQQDAAGIGGQQAMAGYNAQQQRDAQMMGMIGGAAQGIAVASDVRNKTNIVPLEALGYQRTGGSYGQDPTGKYQIEHGTDEFDGPDMRGAPGYSYEYSDPNMPGAAPGRHVGPMAQDLEGTDARGAVIETPNGKAVDTGRLALTTAGAMSHAQRRDDDHEQRLRRLEALGIARQPKSWQERVYGIQNPAIDDRYGAPPSAASGDWLGNYMQGGGG